MLISILIDSSINLVTTVGVYFSIFSDENVC